MNCPKVSVIIPVYNAGQYIEKCARALFGQSLEEIEYIFVNDCSTDDSLNVLYRVCLEYPRRSEGIRVITHEINKGVAAARNTGLQAARGEYIAYADSDDWMDADMYAALYDLACKEDADIAGCNFIEEFEHHRLLFQQGYENDPKVCLRRLLRGEIFPALWCELVRKSLYDEHHITFKEKVDVGEDLAVNVRLYAYASKVVSCALPFYHYRRTNPASYCNVRGEKAINSDIAVAEMITDFLNGKYGEEYFKEELRYRQFIAKAALWSDRNHRDYRRWRNTFPESNCGLWDYRMDWKRKAEFWMAWKGWPFLADAFVKCLHWQRMLRNRFFRS